MTETEVFVLADKALTDVVAQIRDDEWDMNMPPDFVMRQTDHTPQTATSFGMSRSRPTRAGHIDRGIMTVCES
jgi:hypothetical protein